MYFPGPFQAFRVFPWFDGLSALEPRNTEQNNCDKKGLTPGVIMPVTS